MRDLLELCGALLLLGAVYALMLGVMFFAIICAALLALQLVAP